MSEQVVEETTVEAVSEAPTVETVKEDENQLTLDDALGSKFDELVSVDSDNETPQDEDVEASSPEDTEEIKQETATPVIDPPQSWSKDKHEVWSKLSPEAQEVVLEREKQAQSGLTKLGQQLKEFEPVSGVYQKHKAVFDHHGLSLDQGLDIMMNWQAYLDRDPASALKAIAENYNQSLEDIVFADFDNEDGAEASNPQVTALQNQVAQLQQQIAMTQQEQQSFTQSVQEQAQAERQGVVQQFLEQNPDAETLAPYIAHNMDLVRQSKPELSDGDLLKEAYELSLWQNPETRAKLLEKQKAEQASKGRATQAQKADKINVNSNPELSTTETDLDAELLKILSKR